MKKKKMIKLDLKKIKEYGEALKIFIEAVTGRKDIKSRVAVLADPDNLKSMSILTRGQAKFVADSFFVAEVDSWGGLFEGLRDYAKELMRVSPSVGGMGREQTIRFVGALSEAKILSKLGVTMERGEEKEGKKQ